MMKLLVSNKAVYIDDDDYSIVAKYTWWFTKAGYVYTQTGRGVNRETILLHRLVMGLKKGDGLEVDHINRDKLDNRKFNLRLCTRSQNNMNKVSSGVRWTKNKWQAEIKYAGRFIYLGRFSTKEAAMVVRRAAEKKYFGEFAREGG